MTRVFLGGSRHISTLNAEVRLRLDRIVQQRFPVVVGDANGADRAMQRHLSDQRYELVEVYCAGSTARNNVGQWPCRYIETKARPGTFEFYTAKDQAMAVDATVGFMLWDGESVGTMLNAWRLMQARKSSLVFVQSLREFIQLRSPDDWRRLIGAASADARADIEKRIRDETPAAVSRELPLFGPDLDSVGLQ